jgi:hypothetical protein
MSACNASQFYSLLLKALHASLPTNYLLGTTLFLYHIIIVLFTLGVHVLYEYISMYRLKVLIYALCFVLIHRLFNTELRACFLFKNV